MKSYEKIDKRKRKFLKNLIFIPFFYIILNNFYKENFIKINKKEIKRVNFPLDNVSKEKFDAEPKLLKRLMKNE